MGFIVLKRVERQFRERAEENQAARAAVEKAIAATHQSLENLTRLRVRDLINDEEFLRQRQELERERLRMEQARESAPDQNSFEPVRKFLLFFVYAAEWFLNGNDEQKRLILEIAGSNPILRRRNLKIDARKPVRRWSTPFSIYELCAVVEDVRTLCAMRDPEFADTIDKLERLLELIIIN